MGNFIFIGSSNENSANRNAVFREVVEGRVAGAKYLGQAALFRGNSLIYRAATSRKLRRFAKRHGFRERYERCIDAIYRGERGLNVRRLRPLLSDQERNYLIFCHGTRIDRISAATLNALRRQCPGCCLVYYLVDSVERTGYVNGMDVAATLDYLRLFDFVFTYDRSDSRAYPDVLRFIEIPLWRSQAAAPAEPQSELYFCGKDKRRQELLLAIYQRLEEAGLRCRYRIVSNAKGSKERLGVTMSDWTPYEVVVNELLASNCALEIVPMHNIESTLRYKEAVIYNKKLLTTNENIVHLPYYDPRWMRVFHSAEEIDLDWLKRVEPVDYGYRGDYSVENFLLRVEEMT